MAVRVTSLNNLISRERYLELVKDKPWHKPTQSNPPFAPSTVTFKMRGCRPEGIPLQLFLNSPASDLDDPLNGAIGAFKKHGVSEIKLVIWGQHKPRANWEYNVKTLPVTSGTSQIVDRYSLARVVAVEYRALYYNQRGERVASEMPDWNKLTLIALHRVSGNVYQAELGICESVEMFTPRRYAF